MKAKRLIALALEMCIRDSCKALFKACFGRAVEAYGGTALGHAFGDGKTDAVGTAGDQSHLAPVSYTQLDVYKRQGPRLPKLSSRVSQNSSVPSWRRQKFIVHIHPFRLRFPIRRFLYP